MCHYTRRMGGALQSLRPFSLLRGVKYTYRDHLIPYTFAGGYLVKVAADGHVVYKWYHRLFLEAAKNYFLSDKPFTDSLHTDLANYFNGRWVHKA